MAEHRFSIIFKYQHFTKSSSLDCRIWHSFCSFFSCRVCSNLIKLSSDVIICKRKERKKLTLSIALSKSKQTLWHTRSFIQMNISFLMKRKIENWQLNGLAYNSKVWKFWWKPNPSAEEWQICHSKRKQKFIQTAFTFGPFSRKENKK